MGGEAPFFGDMEGKWETVPAKGGRPGFASQQQLPLHMPWPILEPQCNTHSQPISLIGDIFFESVRVSADILLVEEGVGAGLGTRVRLPTNFFRGDVPGLFLYIGATPAADVVNSDLNPGGLFPAPNVPLTGWALCSDSLCANHSVIHTGPLPSQVPVPMPMAKSKSRSKAQSTMPKSGPLVGTWHSLELEVTNGLASGKFDNESIFSGVPVDSSVRPSVSQCVAESPIYTDRVIAGFDYKQEPINGTLGNATEQIKWCLQTCCAESKCKAWGVDLGLCWLKTGGSYRMGPGQNASGILATPPTANVPASGWAALVATIGTSQVDNFKIEGTAGNTNANANANANASANANGNANANVNANAELQSDGDAVTACTTNAAQPGASVVSTPCDYPGTQAQWTVVASATGRQVVQLQEQSNANNANAGVNATANGTSLCIGTVANVDANAGGAKKTKQISELGMLGLGNSNANGIGLVDCTSAQTLVFDATTGRVTNTNTNTNTTSTSTLCLTAMQKQGGGKTPPEMALTACGAIPDESQQFQWNPSTGALRPKGSHCIATFPGAMTVNYRDCCVAVCDVVGE